MNTLKVLLTGARGRIGPHLAPAFRERYDLRTFDVKPAPDDPAAFCGDLQDFAALKSAMEGCDVVVHLAATSNEAPFLESLVQNNVIGLYNTYQAALECGVRRIVFASTCQTVMADWHERKKISPLDPPRPISIYGATKVLGEVLGRFYHDKHGLEFVAIRIGWFLPYDSELLQKRQGIDIWLSPRDAVQIFQLAIEKPDIGYAVVNGTSRTPVERVSLDEARRILGYEPQDDPNDFAPPARAAA
jgi:nucleoside-diphosphate-sugar epimerase